MPTVVRSVAARTRRKTLAGGGDARSDVEVLRTQPALFGSVPSDSTLYRTYRQIDAGTLAGLWDAMAEVRADVSAAVDDGDLRAHRAPRLNAPAPTTPGHGLTAHARTQRDTDTTVIGSVPDRDERDSSVLKTRAQPLRHHARTLVNNRG